MRKQAFPARALACNIKYLSTIICHMEDKRKEEFYGTIKDNGYQR